jgi:hypothetical protein
VNANQSRRWEARHGHERRRVNRRAEPSPKELHRIGATIVLRGSVRMLLKHGTIVRCDDGSLRRPTDAAVRQSHEVAS